MQPLLSMIVPLYNCAAFIEESVFPMLDQLPSDCEAILVDDGSEDQSGEIALKHCKNMENVRVLLCGHKGVSGARNAGLNIANGEYISFMDCDDCLCDGFLEQSRNLLGQKKDYYIFGIERIPLSGKSELWTLPQKDYPDAGAFADAYIRTRRSLIYSNCNKFYRKSVIEHLGLRFDESIDFGEDRLFNYNYLSACGSILTSPLVMLKYIQRDGESMSERYIPHYFEKVMELHKEKMRCFLSLSTNTSSQEQIDFVTYDLLREIEHTIDRFAKHPDEKKENLPLINRLVFGETKGETTECTPDLIWVLGSRSCGYRIEHAYRVGSKKKNQRYLVSGGNPFADTDFTEAEFMAHYLMEMGVPQELIFIENRSHYTEENLKFSSDILLKLGDVETIGIVTAGFHILRTKQLVAEIPELAEKKLLYYPAYGPITSPDNWFDNSAGRQIVFDELEKNYKSGVIFL